MAAVRGEFLFSNLLNANERVKAVPNKFGRRVKSRPILSAVACLALMLAYCTVVRCVAAESRRRFAAFDAKLEIDIEDGEIELTATFTLDADSNKFDLAEDSVKVQLAGGSGSYTVTLPPGSFKPDSNEALRFRGTIEGVKLLASLVVLRGGAFELELVSEGANLRGMANPVAVTLQIGDNGASRSLRAKIE